jgi:hypothetical protein
VPINPYQRSTSEWRDGTFANCGNNNRFANMVQCWSCTQKHRRRVRKKIVTTRSYRTIAYADSGPAQLVQLDGGTVDNAVFLSIRLKFAMQTSINSSAGACSTAKIGMIMQRWSRQSACGSISLIANASHSTTDGTRERNTQGVMTTTTRKGKQHDRLLLHPRTCR